MEQGVGLISANVLSPLAWTAEENFRALLEGRSGLELVDDRRYSQDPLPLALLNWEEVGERFSRFADPSSFTRFEQISLLSARAAMEAADSGPGSGPGSGTVDRETILVISTTKGNVELLEGKGGFPRERMHLGVTAEIIAAELGIAAPPRVVSNACISGVAGLILARRMLLRGECDRVVVVGADVVSPFIVSGFESFKSLSASPCRPFDASRDGLSLGEAASTIILERKNAGINLTGGAITNDANHISGPSRTGEGLYRAIRRTLQGERPDMISAHGTATLYNDESESLALSRAGLEGIPVNSMKGVYGHTLGAAGVLETALSAEAMKSSVLPGTRGFAFHGVSGKIRVSRDNYHGSLRSALKTASGFGGCNAALLLERG